MKAYYEKHPEIFFLKSRVNISGKKKKETDFNKYKKFYLEIGVKSKTIVMRGFYFFIFIFFMRGF